MESVVAGPAASWSGLLRRVDGEVLGTWALTGAVVLYLAIDGGGYDLLVSSQVGIVLWWFVLVGAASRLLPASRIPRAAWAALALFGCFVAWTALASTWSQSSERSLQELSRVACYLGILLLGLAIHRDRARAVRHTANALAAAVVVIAGLALASRLRPDLFPGAQQTFAFLPEAQGRLAWPLNYWNALGALTALALPLLLVIATSARTLLAQAAAAAAIPIVALCGYLTFSRGAAIAAAAALILFLIIAPERRAKLGTALLAAAGSAALIAGAVHRNAIEHGLTNAAARHQGNTLLIAVALVCAGVGVAQVGLALAARHGTIPRWLIVSRRRATTLLAPVIAIGVVIAVVAGAPGRISHAWHDFKHPSAALGQRSIGRFGTVSGNGRYDYWTVAVHATNGHVLDGSGPGTFQLLWLPRAPYESYVQNAHSLYVETLSDAGVVGLGLLAAFLVLVVVSAVRHAAGSVYEDRARAAAAASALVAFCVSAAFDWIWQVPAVPAAFMVLAAAVLGPSLRNHARDLGIRGRDRADDAGYGPSWPAVARAIRLCAIAASVVCLLAIGIPLATTSAVRQSQAAAASGDLAAALNDSRSAVRIEPGAASAQIQAALVLELRSDIAGALAAAHRATSDEPANWSTWLIASRLEAEAGHPAAALASYRRARSLNPRSPIFKQ